MLLASLAKVCNYYKGTYQYIGFGGLAFTDFKLFHKELNIDLLTSIEGGNFSIEKLQFNSPYSFINIITDFSTNALSKINLKEKSLVWLDYDGTLDNYMFQDIQILFSKLPEGSIYLISCNRELKCKSTSKEYTTKEFENKFDNLVPFGIKQKDFTSKNNYKTIRKMILNVINTTLKSRNLSESSNLDFFQLFNLKYEENRGARMYTFGGIIGDKKTTLHDLDLSFFDFITEDEEAYNLEIPNLTQKEIELINTNFDNTTTLVDKILDFKEVEIYKKIYRYLPRFFDVRL
jgi:hypothetical protein